MLAIPAVAAMTRMAAHVFVFLVDFRVMLGISFSAGERYQVDAQKGSILFFWTRGA